MQVLPIKETPLIYVSLKEWKRENIFMGMELSILKTM